MLESWLRAIFLQDSDDVEEVLLNGTRSLQIIDRSGDAKLLSSPFRGLEELVAAVQDFASLQGQRLDPNRPAAGGYWAPRSPLTKSVEMTLRWHAVLRPVASDGLALSFRRLGGHQWSLRDFQASPLQLEIFSEIFGSGSPLFIAGAPGVGKTSLLLALLLAHCLSERVIYIDEFPEIPPLSDYWLCLQSAAKGLLGDGGFSLKQAVAESLRLRPQRLVLGEVRGEEAKALFDCIVASPSGCITSLHLYQPGHLLLRLADLSQRSLAEWQRLFEHGRPFLLMLDERSLRTATCWRFIEGSFQPYGPHAFAGGRTFRDQNQR